MTPKLVCHRGFSKVAPENTFAAADAALDRGAHLIELDVRESADGVLYVMHDQTLDRTTDGTGPIALLSSHEVDALDAGRWFGPAFEGTRVPRLDAYLDHIRARGAGAYVEVKWCTIATLKGVLDDTAMAEHVFTFSFKPEMRAALKRGMPDVRRMIPLGIARNIGVAREVYGADMVELSPEELRPAVLDAARAAGMATMCYTQSDRPEVFETILAAGVDYLNHDHLDVAQSVIAGG